MSLGKRVWGQVVATCVGMGMIAGAFAAYDDIRDWPTIVEFEQVAGRSCKNELAFYQTELRAIKREIQQAEAEKNRKWKRSLEEQKQAVQTQIERVKRECGWS